MYIYVIHTRVCVCALAYIYIYTCAPLAAACNTRTSALGNTCNVAVIHVSPVLHSPFDNLRSAGCMRSLADRFYPRVRVLLVVDYVRSIFVTDKANGSAKKRRRRRGEAVFVIRASERA